jgi:hypothetical protein
MKKTSTWDSDCFMYHCCALAVALFNAPSAPPITELAKKNPSKNTYLSSQIIT